MIARRNRQPHCRAASSPTGEPPVPGTATNLRVRHRGVAVSTFTLAFIMEGICDRGLTLLLQIEDGLC
jgi:hypothetical protein